MKITFRLKGGTGSGHFDHAGIPGHQGGSLPKESQLSKSNISNFLKWTSSKFNEYTKSEAVDITMKILQGNYHLTEMTFTAGAFSSSGGMGGSDYYVNGLEKYLARGHYDENDKFVEEERMQFERSTEFRTGRPGEIGGKKVTKIPYTAGQNLKLARSNILQYTTSAGKVKNAVMHAGDVVEYTGISGNKPIWKKTNVVLSLKFTLPKVVGMQPNGEDWTGKTVNGQFEVHPTQLDYWFEEA